MTSSQHLRFVVLAMLLGTAGLSFGQKRPQDKFADFLKQQWLIGIDVGSNLTQPIPVERYSGILNTANNEVYEKDYQIFANPGIQAGFYITYYLKGLSIAVQPSFRRMQFGYETNYSWGDSPPNQLNYNYTIEQITDYFEIPLWFKYDILKKRFKPYVSVGVSQSLLLNATKKIDLVREDFATGSAISTEDGTVFIGVDDSFQNGFTSLLAGAGMAYDTDSNVRMVVEFTYRETIQNIINPNERYTENELTSVGDVYDDLRLRNVGLSIQFLFPLKYISSQFKSL